MGRQLPGTCVVCATLFAGLLCMTSCVSITGNKEHKSAVNTTQTGFPKLTLGNGVITADVLLPDAEKGFYRGIRFDWSGVLDQIYYRDHTFLYSHEMEQTNPKPFAGGCGTAEEFGMGSAFGMLGPLGYEEAKPGETFIKIGVGVLERPSDDNYAFHKSYPVIIPGKWDVRHGSDWIEFRQEVKGDRGWGYRYTKRIALAKGKPEIVITRTLENTGTKTIETNHYGHNFLILDNDPIGPNYELSFPFTPEVDYVAGGDLRQTRLAGDRITFSEELSKEAVFATFKSFGKTAVNNCFVVKNSKTGTGVRIGGDSPLVRFHLFTTPLTICPEAYVRLEVDPGKSENWKTTYLFSAK